MKGSFAVLVAIAMGYLSTGLPAQTSAAEMGEYSDVEAQKQEPFQIFDNLYYVGVRRVGAHLLKTSEGLILIDTTFDHLAYQVLDNIRKLGFDPSDIKYILISHYHIDHAGGAKRLREATGAKVGLGAEDWPYFAEGKSMTIRGVTYQFPTIPLDIAVKDGDTLTLGETTIKFHASPGHSPGVRSMEYTVYDGAKPHKAVTFGGPGRSRGAENTKAYIKSVERLLAIEDVEVNIPSHPFHNREFEKAELLAKRKPGEPHPFVRPDEWRTWLEQLLDRAKKRLAEEEGGGATIKAIGWWNP